MSRNCLGLAYAPYIHEDAETHLDVSYVDQPFSCEEPLDWSSVMAVHRTDGFEKLDVVAFVRYGDVCDESCMCEDGCAHSEPSSVQFCLWAYR